MKTATKGEITKARIINESTDLINRKGFNTTSISDIINFTGVKKGNLYFHFPSKESLGQAILEKSRDESINFLKRELRGKTPLEKISNYLDAVFKKHKKRKFVGGCLIGNTAIEMGDNNKAYTDIVSEIFINWKDTISKVLSEAKESGELKTDQSPHSLANHIIAVIEGSIMMAKVSKSEKDMKDSFDSLRSFLGINQNL